MNNKIAIVSLIISIASLGIGIYHLTETRPMEEFYFERNRDGDQMMHLWHEYEAAAELQGIVMGILGIVALLLGLVATFKAREPLSYIAIALAVAALLIPLATQTHMFS